MQWISLSLLIACLIVLAARSYDRYRYSTMSGNFPWTVGPVGDTLRFSPNAALTTAELSIDGVLNRVGINKVLPEQSLDVVGNVRVSGAATFGSTLGVTGAITTSSTIAATMTVASATDSQTAQSAVWLRGTINPSAAVATAIPTGLYVTATAAPSSGTTTFAAGMFIDVVSGSSVTNSAGLYVRTPLVGTNRFGVVTNGRMVINSLTPSNWLFVTGTVSATPANHVSQAACNMNMITNPSGDLSDLGVPSALYLRTALQSGSGLSQSLPSVIHAAMNTGSGTITTAASVIARIPTAGTNRYAILTTGCVLISGDNGALHMRQATGTSAGDLCAGFVDMGSSATSVTISTTCVGANDLIFITKRTFGSLEMAIGTVTPGVSFIIALSTSIQASFDWIIIKEAPSFT